MKKTLLLLILLLPGVMMLAETKEMRAEQKHEVRIGWGDQLFETLIWHGPASVISTMPADYSAVYQEDFRYSQHLFAEYSYRLNTWCNFGLMVDGSSVSWKNVTRNGLGVETAREGGHYFYNLAVMPTFRATYFHHPYVNLYSGLGAGVLINGGSEADGWGHKTVAAPAINLTLLGASANYDRFFVSIEYGGMYSFLNANTIFLAKSRMFTASIGVRL